MRLDKVAFAVVLGICTVAKADENVFIDLSVLDSLNGAYVAPSEPLFPVLPKKDKTVQPKIKKAKAKKVLSEKKQKTNARIDKKAKVIEPVVELPAIKEVSETEVVVVDVEPVETSAAIQPVVEAPVAVVDVEPLEKTSEAEVIPNIVSVEKTVDEPMADTNNSQLTKEMVIASPTDETQELLIDEEEPVAQQNLSTDERSIVFADGEDELNSEQMAQIDNIIGHFKDVNANKIAIYSYNLDDGVDSFRKKRVSLNRAVGIRGYLIKQGYKNFSIKVININSGSDKVNTVELEEI